MPYYKLVARTSGPVKCNALSNGFTRDSLSLYVHRRGTLGIIFTVLLVTGGSEQVEFDWLVLKFLSISECKDPRRTEPSSRPDIDSASSRAYVSRSSAFGHPDLCVEARLDPMLMSWTKIILFLCSRPEPVLSIQLLRFFCSWRSI